MLHPAHTPSCLIACAWPHAIFLAEAKYNLPALRDMLLRNQPNYGSSPPLRRIRRFPGLFTVGLRVGQLTEYPVSIEQRRQGHLCAAKKAL